MISGIHHVAISTPDMDRLIQFYCGVLGFELAWRGGWDKPIAQTDVMMDQGGVTAGAALLRAGSCFLELFQFHSPAAKPGDPRRPVIDHGMTHLALAVENIEAEYNRLVLAGMVFHCPPVEAGSDVACTYGRDPDGNVIELIEVRNVRSPFHADPGTAARQPRPLRADLLQRIS